METGMRGATNDKAYAIIEKLEKFGEKKGLVINHKITKFGIVAAGVLTVAVFGTAALGKALYKSITKK